MEWTDIIVEQRAQTEDAKASSSQEMKLERSMWDELNAEDLEDYRFECLYCDFKTLNEELWTAHVKYLHRSPRKTIDQDEECENIDFETLKSEDVESKLHEKIDLDENKTTCFKNECQSDDNLNIESHEDVGNAAPDWADVYVEENDEIQDVPTSKSRKLFLCDQCSYKSDRKDTVKKHVLFMHTAPEEIKWLHCGNCSYRCKWRGYLIKHVKLKHPELKWLHCEHCSFRTYFKKELIDHLRADTHHWFHCDQCVYKSNRKDYMKKHVLVMHTAPDQIKWLHCDKCSYKCKLRRYLNRHINEKHAEIIKLLHCEHCSFRTESKRQFKNHLKMQHIHQWFYCDISDEITWFCCRHCTFRTKYKESLKRHVLEVHAVRKERQ